LTNLFEELETSDVSVNAKPFLFLTQRLCDVIFERIAVIEKKVLNKQCRRIVLLYRVSEGMDDVNHIALELLINQPVEFLATDEAHRLELKVVHKCFNGFV
jgi:hypothetical protein